ncbi:MAG TPA: hypothetical protein VGI39_04305 [Polyangiaceae bacterium]
MSVRHSSKAAQHPSTQGSNPNPAGASPPAAATSPPTAPNPGTVSSAPKPGGQKPPPSDAKIPTPPPDFVSTKTSYRGFLPRLGELLALSGAIQDVDALEDYATLTTKAPPKDQVVTALTVAMLWSSMRKQAANWDAYAITEEGLAWVTARPLIDELREAFNFAVQLDPSLRTRCANLAAFLEAKQQIAKKAASTRTLNRQAKAAGKPEYHGVVGKARQRADQKAAAAANANTKNSATSPAGEASPAATSSGSPVPTTPHS